MNAVQSSLTRAAPRRRPIPWATLLSAFGLILVTVIYLLPVGYIVFIEYVARCDSIRRRCWMP